MRTKGYALITALVVSLFLMAMSLLAFQSAHTQSLLLVSEGRRGALEGEGLNALRGAVELLEAPATAQAWGGALAGDYDYRWGLGDLSLDLFPGYQRAVRGLCGLNLPGYPNTVFLPGLSPSPCGGGETIPAGIYSRLSPGVGAVRVQRLQGRGALALRHTFPLVAVTRTPRGGTAYAFTRVSVWAALLPPGRPPAFEHGLVVESGGLSLGPTDALTGLSLVQGGLTLSGRPSIGGNLLVRGATALTTGTRAVSAESLQPSPHAPCYGEACPVVAEGLSWRPDALDPTVLRGGPGIARGCSPGPKRESPTSGRGSRWAPSP